MLAETEGATSTAPVEAQSDDKVVQTNKDTVEFPSSLSEWLNSSQARNELASDFIPTHAQRIEFNK